MSKTSTSLSSQVQKIEKTANDESKKIQELENQFEELINQHAHLVAMHKETAVLQGEIAKQIMAQHDQINDILKVLGLKRDLSEYSYRVFDGPAN